jgi:hypothetical protein
LRGLKKWPAGKPFPAGSISLFYDPVSDDEYQLDLSRLGGPGGAAFELVPTETLGGITAGMTYNLTPEGFFRALLVKYQAPGFSFFRFDGQGSRIVPVGTTFPAGFKSFTWDTTNSDNVQAASLRLQDVTLGTLLADKEANDGVLSASTAGFTAVLGESHRFQLAGTNSNGDAFSAEVIITGETEAYLGFSTETSLTPAQVVALGGAQLQGSRARSASGLTASGGQYLYYAYDARHGDLAGIILDGAAPVLGAFRKLGDVAITNAAGASVTVRVYRSNAPNAFSNNSLAFS